VDGEGKAMTEKEWLECADPSLMLQFMRGRVSDRKLRLFAVGYCRCIWPLLTDSRAQQAVAAGEEFADQRITKTELETVWEALFNTKQTPADWAVLDATAVIPLRSGTIVSFDWEAAWSIARRHPRGMPEMVPSGLKEVDISDLLRDVVGNPFHPLVLESSWLTPTVTTLAQAAYDERKLPAGLLDPDRLGVLSDALEDAGCSDPAIIDHLRSPGPHVRGCHVVDTLLGKT